MMPMPFFWASQFGAPNFAILGRGFMKIREMQPGQVGRVVAYTGKDRAYRHKLLRMGVNKGVEFTFLRKAPLGDPLEINVRGFMLSLRKGEADALDIELVSPEEEG
jgi:ferrous iron transport protein A